MKISNTECFVCGGNAIGLFKTHKSHKSVPMCAECARKVFEMHRVVNKVKEVSMENIF